MNLNHVKANWGRAAVAVSLTAIFLIVFQNCSRQTFTSSGAGSPALESAAEVPAQTSSTGSATRPDVTTTLIAGESVTILTPGRVVIQPANLPLATVTAEPTTATNSSGCRPDPVGTTEFYLSSANRGITILISLCKDGIPLKTFVVGQTIHVKIIPINNAALLMCIARHNTPQDCMADTMFNSLPNATYSFDGQVFRATIVVDAEMAGYGYTFAFKQSDSWQRQSGWVVLPNGVAADTKFVSNSVGLSKSMNGANIDSIKVGETLHLKVPALSKASLVMCVEDLALGACRNISEYSNLGSDAIFLNGYLHFTILAQSVHAGKNYVFRFYDKDLHLYRESANVLKVLN